MYVLYNTSYYTGKENEGEKDRGKGHNPIYLKGFLEISKDKKIW